MKKCLPTSRIKTGKPNKNITFIKFYLLYQKNNYTFATIPTASTFIPLSVGGIIFLIIPVSAVVQGLTLNNEVWDEKITEESYKHKTLNEPALKPSCFEKLFQQCLQDDVIDRAKMSLCALFTGNT